MPFFFIVPLWILCLLAGIVLFCFARLRSFSLYLLFASTGFTICSFLCSMLVLVVAGRWPGLFWHSGLVAVGGYVGALLAGGAAGTAGGLLIAYRINYRRKSVSQSAER
jgi:hypothetical protein